MMGMFDTVLVPCPKCGEEMEFQSKSGPCQLEEYKLGAVPAEILAGASIHTETCSCGARVKLVLQCMAVPTVVRDALPEVGEKPEEGKTSS